MLEILNKCTGIVDWGRRVSGCPLAGIIMKSIRATEQDIVKSELPGATFKQLRVGSLSFRHHSMSRS